MRKRRSPKDDACEKARRRALAKARAEARAVLEEKKKKMQRESYVYAKRVCERMAKGLRRERETRGFSRCALAEAAGMSRDMLWRVEGGVSVPSVFVLGKVAKAFRVPFEWLVAALCARCRR